MIKKIANVVLNLTVTPILDTISSTVIIQDPYKSMWIDYFSDSKDKNSQNEIDISNK